MARIVGTNSRSTGAPIPCSTGRLVTIPSGNFDQYLSTVELQDIFPILTAMQGSGYLSFQVFDGTDNAGPVPVTSSRSGGSFGAIARVMNLGAPVAKGAANVAAAFAGNTATNPFPGPFTNPDVPRNLRVTMAASWDGGAVVVSGTDQFGAVVSESFAAGSGVLRVGTKIFKTVTGATKGAVGVNAATASVGTGDTLGVPYPLQDTTGLLYVTNILEASTLSTAGSSCIPTSIPDGAKTFVLLANV